MVLGQYERAVQRPKCKIRFRLDKKTRDPMHEVYIPHRVECKEHVNCRMSIRPFVYEFVNTFALSTLQQLL